MKLAGLSDRLISVVIPLRDERESLAQLALELRQACATHGLRMEFIFVDDGSSDGSWETLRLLSREDNRIRGIRLSRHCGKAAALAAGFEAASGQIFVQMDADLEDVPGDLPRFLEKLDEGYDIANGWKNQRHEPRLDALLRRVFNGLMGRLTGLALHDFDCGFKCVRAEVVKQLEPGRYLFRDLPVVAYRRGYRVTELPIRHRPRRWGRSKSGPGRTASRLRELVAAAFPALAIPRAEVYSIRESIPGSAP